MNKQEKMEIEKLPSKYQPIGAWAYFWLTILYNIPVLGFIFLIIHAIGAGKIAVRSFARSFFCAVFLALILVGVCVVLVLLMPEMMEIIKPYLEGFIS